MRMVLLMNITDIKDIDMARRRGTSNGWFSGSAQAKEVIAWQTIRELQSPGGYGAELELLQMKKDGVRFPAYLFDICQRLKHAVG